jgi:hypothetical protein
MEDAQLRWFNCDGLHQGSVSPVGSFSSIPPKHPFHDAGDALGLTGICHLYALLAFGFSDLLFGS